MSSGAYDALTSEQRALVDTLSNQHASDLERWALLQLLLQPGMEEAFLARYFSERLEAKLEDFHMRLINTALNEPRGLVLFPAQHGKTTLISGLLPILEMIRNPNTRIAIIAKNDDEATAIMSSIQAELEQNELLKQDYGPFRPDSGDPMRKWSTTFLSLRQRTRLGKEHTLAVFGAGSRQILGWRTDWVICDDVVTEKNSATEDQRAKHVTWFNDCVATSPQKKKAGAFAGRITVVGTMFHPRDLYATIKEKADSKGVLVYKSHREDAIRDWETKSVLWPAVWTWEEMMDIRASEGTLSFNKRYRNEPVDESEQPFREDHLRGGGELPRGGRHPGCLNRYRVMGPGGIEDHWSIFQALDPAVGTGKNSKFVGHIVFGVDKAEPRKIYIVEINRDQLTVPQQRDRIIETHLKYPNMMLSITEKNAYQAGLRQIIDERCQQLGIVLRIEEHTTGQNKQDPEIGIPSLSVVTENAELDIPYGNPESIRKAEMLLEELIQYPFFKYSDLLMALWFGYLKSRTTIGVYKSFNRLNPKSRYRPPSGRRTVRNPYFPRHVATPTDTI